MEKFEKTIRALSAHGFEVFYAEGADKTLEKALELTADKSVGIGGSVTVAELGLYERLKERGNKVYWHWKDGAEARYDAARADIYVCSANAVTESGEIVLTDGGGNRVAGLSFGTGSALIIVGKNKLVKDIPEAIERIKSGKCSGRNAARLGLKLPCSTAGKCADCSSPQRICSVTAIFERPSRSLAHTYVILADCELGY